MKLRNWKITHEHGWWWSNLREKFRSLKPKKYRIIHAYSWGPFLLEKIDG